MESLDIRVASNGRMVLPLAVRNAMGLHGETKVIATIVDGEVRLAPIASGIARAQALYQQHVTADRSTAEFLAARAAEAARESDGH
jgi:antitoxin PrlF